MDVPAEYVGREQTWLKHRVLKLYLESWTHKLSSTARTRGTTRLWYVDCFAGPWNSRHVAQEDTSPFIGLRALREAAAAWREKGHDVRLGAIFVEPTEAFHALVELVQREAGAEVEPFTYHGEFGDLVPRIRAQLGDDAAFLFVDPTGWKGAAMKYIEPLMQARIRDVMVNVMFDYLNRFKDAPLDFIREQLRDFVGMDLATLPASPDERELMAIYREQLKVRCGIEHTADLAIPYPTQERTYFRMVVGGKHRKVLELFRDVERKVVGGEAAAARDAAKRRREFEKTGQLSLGIAPPRISSSYGELSEDGRRAARKLVVRSAQHRPGVRFRELWPDVLEQCHITVADLKALVWDLHRDNTVRLGGVGANQRTAHDDHQIFPGRDER